MRRSVYDRVTLRHRLKVATPVLVYQMGKVGSTSLGRSLASTYPGVAVNTHDFFPEHRKWLVRRLYREVKENRGNLDVITLVREPVGRNVSAFFENYERDTGVSYRHSNLTVQQLRKVFLTNYRHDLPLGWFENHIEREFDIDVYASTFPDDGYKSYQKGSIRLLVLRAEIADETKEQAIRDFLGLPGFQLVRANVGDYKEYADQYQAFKEQIRLPREYVERMCESRYFTHFYSPEAIEAVRRRWSEVADESDEPVERLN